MTTFSFSRIFLIQVVLVLASVGRLLAADRVIDMRDPAQVIHAYLRATYARDFIEAYRFISFKDRKFRDVNRYVQQRGAFSGFTLEVGKKVSESIQIRVFKKEESANRARAEIHYSVPDPSKIAPLVLNWDPFRLNALPDRERSEILAALEKRKNDGAIEMREGKEHFDLVKEGDEWRVFLNWAAGIRISLQTALPESSGIEVSVSKNQVVIQPGDMFEILLRIKNRSKEPMGARIGHLIEPRELESFLDFVECGFLVPVTLEAEKEQEYSARYLLRETIPEGIRQLNLKYDFTLRRLLRLK